MRPAPALLAALLAAAGCATAPRAEPRCPESVETCLTPVDCVRDARRGCVLCVCRAWDDTKPRSGGAGNAVPEENRPPPPARAP